MTELNPYQAPEESTLALEPTGPLAPATISIRLAQLFFVAQGGIGAYSAIVARTLYFALWPTFIALGSLALMIFIQRRERWARWVASGNLTLALIGQLPFMFDEAKHADAHFVGECLGMGLILLLLVRFMFGEKSRAYFQSATSPARPDAAAS